MEVDFKPKMAEDLRRRLDRLYAMKMQPGLHLSQKFDEIINLIDLDAERILQDLSDHSESNPEKPQSAREVNEARCEFVRILKALEQNLQSRLLANEPKKVDKAFAALEERVKDLESTPFSVEDDINEFEDTYVQLVLEVTEMAIAKEKEILANQTVFYMKSMASESALGILFHLTGVYLTKEQIESAR